MSEKVEIGLEVVAYATPNEDGDLQMLFFDNEEAATYVDDGDSPQPLVRQSDAERALQIEMERHRKTWRQLEQVTGLLREMRDAMNRYEADCDEYPPFHHNQMMDRVGAALSQQAEPLEPAPEQDEREACDCAADRRLVGEGCRTCNLDDDIHQLAFEVGDPAEDASGYWFDMESFGEFIEKLQPIIREPYEDVLRSLACSLGAGGYNAPAVDPAIFEQKIRWGIDQLTRPAQTAPQGKFRMGDLVKKSTGSEWEGRVVGTYSTEQTKEGYAVESSAHRNSVQIYPAKALEAVE